VKPRTWEWSNKNEDDYRPQFKTVEAGEQYIYIDNAEYDPETKKYVFDMTSLSETGGSFKIFQRLTKNDGSTNFFGLKWLNALGYACSGYKTVLQADEMAGCVFLATITLEPSFQDKKRWEEDMAAKGVSDVRLYPVINPDSIQPVTKDIVEDYSTHVDENGQQDQFFTE
jgi:hypothetical protein